MNAKSDHTTAKTRWERLKWARKAAGYDTATAAFEAFGWDSVDTYRSHERAPRGESFGFDEEWGRRYAAAFRVDWLWLMHGQGYPKRGLELSTYEAEWERMTPEDKAMAVDLWKTTQRRA